MRIGEFEETLEKHFELFEKTNITLETSVKDKIKIIEENKYKKALIKVKDIPNRYISGKLEPKNGIFFGLKVTKPQVEMNYFEIISYESLAELIVCGN
jgi:hypothetical protein